MRPVVVRPTSKNNVISSDDIDELGCSIIIIDCFADTAFLTILWLCSTVLASSRFRLLASGAIGQLCSRARKCSSGISLSFGACVRAPVGRPPPSPARLAAGLVAGDCAPAAARGALPAGRRGRSRERSRERSLAQNRTSLLRTTIVSSGSPTQGDICKNIQIRKNIEKKYEC